MAVSETIWVGQTADKIYVNSGQFTLTVRESQSIVAFDSSPTDCSWDGTNIPWVGASGGKLYLQSGKITSTVKDSLVVSGIDSPRGIDADLNSNTPWTGVASSKLYLQSGRFSSTLKTSLGVTGAPESTSFDGTDTCWGEYTNSKLFKQSGQFTSTVKTSQIYATLPNVFGSIYDGTNCLISSDISRKHYLASGYFTSTLKTSLLVSGIDTGPRGLDVDDYQARQGVDPTIRPPPGGGGRPTTSRGRILTARDDRKLREKIEAELSEVEKIQIDTAAMSRVLDIIFREVEQEKAVENARQEERITQIIRETISFEHKQRGVEDQLKLSEQIILSEVKKGNKDLEAFIALLLARLL